LTKTKEPVQVNQATARKSTLIVAGVLLAIAAWSFYRGRTRAALVLGIIGGMLLLTGLLVPPLARQFHIFWMRLAGVLGYVNSRILLSLMFYLVFAPYNLISRLVGRDPLDRRKPGRSSYWIARKNTRQTKEQFERLF
jgi:hypothetical protein